MIFALLVFLRVVAPAFPEIKALHVIEDYLDAFMWARCWYSLVKEIIGPIWEMRLRDILRLLQIVLGKSCFNCNTSALDLFDMPTKFK